MAKYAAFGKKVRAIRLNSRLLQKQVADLIGMTEVEYNEFEQGVSQPTAQIKEDLFNLYPSKPRNYWEDEGAEKVEKKLGTLTQLNPIK